MYSKTYAHVIIVALGMFGIASTFTEGDLAKYIDMTIQIIGMVGVIYERYQKGGISAFGFKLPADWTIEPVNENHP